MAAYRLFFGFTFNRIGILVLLKVLVPAIPLSLALEQARLNSVSVVFSRSIPLLARRFSLLIFTPDLHMTIFRFDCRGFQAKRAGESGTELRDQDRE